MKRMEKDIPNNVLNLWEKGLVNKEQDSKEDAMKEFLGFFDLLSIFSQSYNLNYFNKLLQKRLNEVKNEIQELLLDEDYLKITVFPQEGIDEIKTRIGMTIRL